MTIIQIIELIISIVLFILIIYMLFFTKRKRVKVLVPIIFVNLIVITHMIVGITTKTEENITVSADKTYSANTSSPVISLKGQKEVYLSAGEVYQESGYSAVDNNGNSIVSKVNVQKEVVDDSTYKLVYNVKGLSGNKVSEERIVHLQKHAGIIYLTFDDGPSNSSTPKILDILKKENVKATFFLLNYTKANESLVKREIEEGHSVGIHGFSHDYKKIYKSVDTYMENLNKLQDKIYKSTGVKTVITRFPGGSSNTISKFNPGIMTKLSKEVLERGYRYYDWNITSGDAGDLKTAKAVYNNVIKQLSKDSINIILMHDFENNNKTINSLEKIIKYGKKHGYTFAAITSQTPMLKHKVQN